MSKPEFAIYVSSVPGKTFVRPGTTQIIGAVRSLDKPQEGAPAPHKRTTKWNADRVYGIPVAEYGRYRKEYHRALDREKSLKPRTEADWLAQCAAEERAQKVARDAAEKAQKEAATRITEAESPTTAPLVATDTP